MALWKTLVDEGAGDVGLHHLEMQRLRHPHLIVWPGGVVDQLVGVASLPPSVPPGMVEQQC